MRIFIKIFLTFWLVIVALVVVSIVLTYTQGSNSILARIHRITTNSFNIYAQTASEIYERQGQNALDTYLKRVNRSSHIYAYLFDNQGEVSHLNAPPYAYYVKQRLESRHRHDFLFKPNVYWEKEQVTGPSGKQYTLVIRAAALHPSHMVPVNRGILLIAVAAVICYLLTSNITKPIVAMRNATQKLAEGRFPVKIERHITNRQDELGALGRDFDAMAAQIEALLTAQKRLLADISHELRSPLARMDVALELARRGANEETASMLERIGRESARMNAMIGQLSLLTKLESGSTLPHKREKIDICTMVQEIVFDAEFEATPMYRNVRLAAPQVDGWDCMITGDSELIRSAIENVARNAVRYTAENTTVDISIRYIESPGNTAIVTIQDHGPGIPEEHLGNIFRPFFRLSESRDRESGGVGLGLAIAERAIKSHGGKITASNAENGGLTVEIRLPV